MSVWLFPKELPHCFTSSSVTLIKPPICFLNTTTCISRRSSCARLHEMAQQISEGLPRLLAFLPACSPSAWYSFYNPLDHLHAELFNNHYMLDDSSYNWISKPHSVLIVSKSVAQNLKDVTLDLSIVRDERNITLYCIVSGSRWGSLSFTLLQM